MRSDPALDSALIDEVAKQINSLADVEVALAKSGKIEFAKRGESNG